MSASIDFSAPMTPLDGALAEIERGGFVFPIHACGTPDPAKPGKFLDKRPRIDEWQHNATNDKAQVLAWAKWFPDCNWAGVPKGELVVDLDVKHGKDGPTRWQELQATHGKAADTYRVTTASGGQHLRFAGFGATSGDQIAPGIDIRSQSEDGRSSGYVLLPGSRVINDDGSTGIYEVENDAPVAPAPAWLLTAVAKPKRERKPAPEGFVPGDPASADRAVTWLKQQPTVVEFQGSDAATFKIAAQVISIVGSEEGALALMLEHFDFTPWRDDTPDWIAAKVANAWKHMENEPGCDAAPGSAARLLPESETRAPANGTQDHAKRSRFQIEDTAMQDAEPDAAWLIPDILMDDDTTLLFGPMKEFKSFVALDIALSVATGLAGFAGKPVRTGPVIWAANEGRRETGKPRRRAWMLAHGRPAGEAIPFFTMPAPQAAVAEDVGAFIAAIRSWCRAHRIAPPALIVLDTVAKSMTGMNENSAQDVGVFLEMVEQLRAEFGCAVLCIHHTGLAERDRARGSSALPAGFANLLSVKGDKRKRTARVTVVANRGAAEREQPWELKGDVHGPALAFRVATAAEQKSSGALREVPFYQIVMTALAKAGAFGQANALRRQEMAKALVGKPNGMTETEFNSAIGAMAKKLDKGRERAGKDKLAPLAGCFGDVWNETNRADGTPNTEIRFFRDPDPECWENPADWRSDEPEVG